MLAGDAERFAELARSGAEFLSFQFAPPLLHLPDATTRFQGPDEDESVLRAAFDEQIEEPVHAVVQIHVGGAGWLLLHKLARAWS